MKAAADTKAIVRVIHATKLGITGSPVFGGIESPQRIARVISVLEDIRYRDWQWCLMVTGAEVTIASTFHVEDSTTHEPIQLSFTGAHLHLNFYDDNDAELEKAVLRVAWSAVKEFALHEAREWFRYKGVMIYDPHKLQEKSTP